jgi:glycerol-3-phosphate dehydrogenase
MSFSALSRASRINELKSTEYDLLIIGGGISGAGVARDAASRGMKVALVEADDFASGTSSRSSKLIHGGIRYLENFEFGLVFEALQERRNLFSMAPHLVHPLRFVLPVYKDSRVGMFKMSLGMWLYDALSMFEAPRMHECLSAEETLDRVPMLDGENLCGSYVYSDAYMDDDRLVIETLRSAISKGAQAVNFISAVGAEFSEAQMNKVKCRDNISGNEFSIRAKHFISTVGPWTDVVAHKLLSEWKNQLRPSKGVHLTFARDRVQLDEAVVMISADQKRIVFGIPRNEMIIFGTTDTDFPNDPREVRTEREDVDYILQVVSDYFPNSGISEKDILASYSGVRPLVYDGSQTESGTSREHLILADPRNITFLTGGKYTTYRKMAEQTVEAALENFNFNDKVRFSRADTLSALNPLITEAKLNRARNMVSSEAASRDLDIQLVRELVERHGEEAFEMLSEYGPASLWEIEAKHAIHKTMCCSLKDFYLRRSPLVLSRQDNGLGFLPEISKVFKEELNLSEDQLKAQIADLKAHFSNEMGWRG